MTPEERQVDDRYIVTDDGIDCLVLREACRAVAKG
jgi:hypothetical protein